MQRYLLAKGGGAYGRRFTAAGDSEAKLRAAKLRRKFGKAAKLYRHTEQGWVPVS